MSYLNDVRRLRGLPGRFWILWSCTLVNRLGTSVVALLALYLSAERGLSPAAVGLFVALRGVGTVVSPLIGGRLSDRIGPRLTMVLGMTSNAVALVVTGLAASPVPLAVAVLALGLTDSIYRPGMSQSISSTVGERDKGLAFELQFFAISLGTAISAAVAGFLAEQSFLLVFLLDAATSLVFAAIALGFLRDGPHRAKTEEGASPDHVSTTSAPRTGVWSAPLVLFLVATTIFAAIYAQTLTALPIHMVRAGLSTGDYGLALSLNALLVLVVQPLAGPWLLRYPRQLLLSLGQGAAGLAIACTAFCQTVPTVMASVVAWSLAEIAVGARGTALATDLGTRSSRPGLVVGAYSSAYAVGALLGSSAGSALASAGYESVLWSACAVGAVVAVLAQLSSARASRTAAVAH